MSEKLTPVWKDQRRQLMVPGNYEETVNFAASQWLEKIASALMARGRCFVALSGGSTPKAIFSSAAQRAGDYSIDWNKVLFFWSDERCVPLTNDASNYKMALDAGLSSLPIPTANLYPMYLGNDPVGEGERYTRLLNERMSKEPFDIVMLGLGKDGHIASLFPETEALQLQSPPLHAVANYVPSLEQYRMTLTYPTLHHTRFLALYATGKEKGEIIAKALSKNAHSLPVHRIGTPDCPAVFLADHSCAEHFLAVSGVS